MATLTRADTLSAVNVMLLAAGNQPVSSVENTGIVDVDICLQVLHDTSRQLQSRGWESNTDEEYELIPNVDGEIVIPPSALRCDPSDTTQNVVQRAGKLYNKDTRSFQFVDSVPCDITWFFAYEDISVAMQQYITIAATRSYQASAIGGVNSHRFTQDEMEDAWLTLLDEQREIGDYRFLQ